MFAVVGCGWSATPRLLLLVGKLSPLAALKGCHFPDSPEIYPPFPSAALEMLLLCCQPRNMPFFPFHRFGNFVLSVLKNVLSSSPQTIPKCCLLPVSPEIYPPYPTTIP